jgi:hypothetical protein
VSWPTQSDIEQLLAECWEITVEKGPASMRMVQVDDLAKLADLRGFDASTAERVADDIVRQRGGSRHRVGDPSRFARNLCPRLVGRRPIPAREIWLYPAA